MGTSVVGKSLLAALFCLTVGCACNRPAEYYAMQDRDRYAEPSEEEAQPSQEPQEPSGEPEASADASPDPVQELVSPTDMVLLYGGNKARKPYKWTTSYMKDYVLYRDREDKAHWLFDGFLLLELKTESSSRRVCFASGYRSWDGTPLPSATQEDWQDLIDYYFDSKSGLDAIEAAIQEAAGEIGEPPRKRMVVMSIPEPITRQSWSEPSTSIYWGKLDGKEMNFANLSHRELACRWFIDTVRERFRAKEYKYLELTGFYWLPEDCGTTSALIGRVAAYLNDNALSFNWIPYFHAEGYAQWKTYGFNFAYYQPNYFFYEVDASRVDQACKEAAEYGLSMEMEFDEDALVAGGKGDRLRSYMDGFRKYGAWEKQNMAYYQGGWAVKALKDSDVAEDNDLYHEFCEFVISRPIRETH